MAFRQKYLSEHPDCDITDVMVTTCPHAFGYEEYIDKCPSPSCHDCWNREMPDDQLADARKLADEINQNVKISSEVLDEFRKAIDRDAGKILDSGNRRVFESGAVRDIQEGKGRCDLLPLYVVSRLYTDYDVIIPGYSETVEPVHLVLVKINCFTETGNWDYLYEVLKLTNLFDNYETMILEVSKHFEEGCKKYGENNWRKGIPARCYIDSAVRHYLKHLRGDTDEPHDRAFVWNIMCCIWTCMNKPELNEYAPVATNGT